tara:strand:+ start:319 stop:891 length:573 start_codon:yes stop_codon:yes gene_type:complete
MKEKNKMTRQYNTKNRRKPNRYGDEILLDEDIAVEIFVENNKYNDATIVDKSFHIELLKSDNPRVYLRPTRDGKCIYAVNGSMYLHHMVFGRKARKGYEIDHINKNKLDNRKKNLREITTCQNRSSLTHKAGREYPRNISYDKRSRRRPFFWSFQHEGATFREGRFRTIKEAIDSLKLQYKRIKGIEWVE